MTRRIKTVLAAATGATAALMVGFYQGMQQTDKAEALRQAQLKLLHSQEWAHPYYWSAFVLIGDWR